MTRLDRIKNEYIRGSLKVIDISRKMGENKQKGLDLLKEEIMRCEID